MVSLYGLEPEPEKEPASEQGRVDLAWSFIDERTSNNYTPTR